MGSSRLERVQVPILITWFFLPPGSSDPGFFRVTSCISLLSVVPPSLRLRLGRGLAGLGNAWHAPYCTQSFPQPDPNSPARPIRSPVQGGQSYFWSGEGFLRSIWRFSNLFSWFKSCVWSNFCPISSFSALSGPNFHLFSLYFPPYFLYFRFSTSPYPPPLIGCAASRMLWTCNYLRIFFFRQQASIRTCMSRIVALGHVTRAEWGATLRYLLCGVGWVCRGSADLCSCDGGSEECILMVFEVRFRWWVF